MSKTRVLQNFEEFGNKMYVIAILSIVSIFTMGIAQMAIWILLFISLKHIKMANEELKSEDLEDFRSKMTYALIITLSISIIGFITTLFSIFRLIQSVQNISNPPDPDLSNIFVLIDFHLILLIISFIVNFTGMILLIMAWKRLNKFFNNNSEIFQRQIAEDAIDGTNKLKNAYMLYLVGMILVIFIIIILILMIPILVSIFQRGGDTSDFQRIFLTMFFIFIIISLGTGAITIASFILMIIGYSKLSHLKNL
jgi:cytochrome b561